MTVNNLKQKLQEMMKLALKNGEKERLVTLRMAIAEVKRQEIDQQQDLNDDAITTLISKMIKQRKEAKEQFEAAGRADLAEKEQFETTVLQEFLPPAMPQEEVEKLINDAVKELEATSMGDMGKVMSALRPKIQGRADMQLVSSLVKTALTV